MTKAQYHKKNITEGKYRPFPPVQIEDRTWPNRQIEKAPMWCSVDLRDGNQALFNPMSIEQKMAFFDELVRVGFKEIEIGFPAASQTDFDFTRLLISSGRIPGDVTIQVLVQAREELVKRTFEALDGAQNVIVHLYNSTSPAQRRDVFGMEKEDIVKIAVSGVEMIKKEMAQVTKGQYRLEYSPESFSSTELAFSKDIANAVIGAWNPVVNGKMILNLPATVEVSTPNIHADQIEWMCRHIEQREHVIVSVHAHNDRGCAVAASELALLAGADRVEGTLFGNGERTGNTDLVTMALNMYTQGVDPQLNLYDVDRLKSIYQRETGMTVHPRHPYAGELVYTAFSGSHQDAISKGLKARRSEHRVVWDVPYLPIDPIDVKRSYEAIVRINSQSGKGGVAYVLEAQAGYALPRALQILFSQHVQEAADRTGEELEPVEIEKLFTDEFVNREQKYALVNLQVNRNLKEPNAKHRTRIDATLKIGEVEHNCDASGDGIIDALSSALRTLGLDFKVTSFDEHALDAGSNAQAAAYIGIQMADGRVSMGAGVDTDIAIASARALLCALNRA
ncbi:MAG: 2-isopropylmalate synthase [Deltaproteobacteria bacterium]|nr:2-isopropylmalate synthase [Deltaproteobacteria bacterium]